MNLRFPLAAAALLAQSAATLLLLGCQCHDFLPANRPIRVVLLEPYVDGGTFIGGSRWHLADEPSLPSCDAIDHLSETSPIIVAGHHLPGGEACNVTAPIAVDMPILVPQHALTWGDEGRASSLPIRGSVETELDHCPGRWTLGMQQLEAGRDPFVAPTPGAEPPWVVVRTFVTTAPCAWIPGLEQTGSQCEDVFAARLELVTR